VPKRVINGDRIYAKAWNSVTRDCLIWLVGVGADGYGLSRKRVAAMCEDMSTEADSLRPEQVERGLCTLSGDGTIIPYSVDGTDYYCFPHWQDHQVIGHPGTPKCPLPPPEIFRQLSRKTQELFAHIADELPPALAVALANALALANIRGSRKLTRELAEARQRAIDDYYERLQRFTGAAKPEFNGGQAARFYSRRLVAGDTPDDLLKANAYFFDSYVKEKSACNFSHFQRVYNHILHVLCNGDG